MAKTFDEFLSLADEVARLVRKLKERLRPFERQEHVTPTMLGAIADAASEIAETADPSTVDRRPKDATEDEWDSPVVALLRSRIESLRFASSQRPKDSQEWMQELRLACDEFERSYAEFNERVER